MSDHRVIFYEREQDFVDQVAGFLAEGLTAGDACVAIATGAHRAAIAAELTARGLLGNEGGADSVIYRALDAGEILRKYMVAGWPDAQQFAEAIEPVLVEASGGGRKPLQLFGEMVALEFEAGNKEAAIRIEELWNGLAGRHEFSLLCAYPIGQASKMKDYTSLLRVCAEHTQTALPMGLWTGKHLAGMESEA
ncbi:MAG TPA: MEDS domain-containing protein [Gammaproteobacteria bacterium]